MTFVSTTLLPTLILLIGLVDDLWTRKFHNWLFISLFLLTFVLLISFEGSEGLLKGLWGLAVAIALSLPLVLFGVMGAGDLKLLMVFALATNASVAFNVIVMAFVWGGMIGLLYAIVSGQFIKLFNNFKYLILYHIRPAQQSLNQIPYTASILLAWLTQILILTPYEVKLWT